MPNKAAFKRFAGEFCAEQAEIARPILEKIAKEATDIKTIDVYPCKWMPNPPFGYPSKPSEVLNIA